MICFMESKSEHLAHYDPIVAVLTGDIVGSENLPPDKLNAVMAQIRKSATDLAGMADADTLFTRFQGDGWQIILRTAKLALRASLIIMADLRAAGLSVETRISVGVGEIESLGTTNLADASGGAFFVSGRHLADMPGHRRLAIAGGRQHAPHGVADKDWQAAIFDMAEWIAGRWSQPQAEAMAMALRFDWQTQDDLARRLGITRQAMHARLSGAGFQAMTKALYAIQKYEWDPAP
jgi:hypothetical protein